MATTWGEPESTARNSVTVAVWTLVSRVSGLARVLVIGAMLGPTYFANIFQAGYVLPNNVFALVAGPVLGMVSVPMVVRALSRGGPAHAAEVLGLVAGRLLAVAGFGALALALVSPLLAWTLVFGMPEPIRGRAWLLCTVLIVFVAPQVLLYTLAELGVAAQQGRQRFRLAAAAPSVENLGTIATLLVTAVVFGSRLDVQGAPLAMMLLLGAGSTGSVLLHAALQCYGAVRAGVPVRPRRGWREYEEARSALHRIVRSISVAGAPAFVDYGLTVVAATVPGGVLVVQLCYQVYAALSFVGSRAVSIAALPGLAGATAARDPARFGASWRQGLFYALAAGVPLLLLLAVFAGQTADLLANGALRDAMMITTLAGCLVVAAFAQLAGGLHDYARQALFARFDDRGPSRASVVGLVASAVVAAAALLLPAGGPRLIGLVAAILAGELASAATALTRLRRGIRPEPMLERRHLATLAVATVVTLPVLAAGWWLLDTLRPRRMLELALLVGCGLAVLVPYGLVLLARERPRRAR